MNSDQNHTVTGTRKDVVKAEQSERALIAYHADCIDGFTSAWVTAMAMEERGMAYELLPMHYTLAGDRGLLVALENLDCSKLYVVDFSLSIEMLELLANTYPTLKVTVIDHHKTAFERYAPALAPIESDSTFSDTVAGALIVLDNYQSGASLCFLYFSPSNTLPELVKYVRDYDLWLFDFGDETKWMNKYLSHRPFSITAWSRIAAELETLDGQYGILQEGKRLQAAHDFKVDTLAKGAVSFTFLGHGGLCVECPRELASDVGQVLADKSGTFGAMYQVNLGSQEVNWSLRSNGDFDVSAIAKKFGGGGHKNAAGFTKRLF